MKNKSHKLKLIYILFFLFTYKYGKSQSFTFQILPSQKTIYAGDTTSFDITVTPTGGYSASISFNLELPNCLNNNITITPAISNFPYANIKVKLTNTSMVAPSIYPIIIKGANGPLTTYDSCSLNILPSQTSFNWITYQTINSGIQSNSVSGVAVDKHGKTWITSRSLLGPPYDGKLTTFDGIEWDVYTANDNKVYDNCGNLISTILGSFLPDLDLMAIAIDTLDNKWIGESSDGLIKIDSVGNWTYYNTSNSLLPSDLVLSIEVDLLNQVWIATDGGLVKINNGVWTIYNTSNTILPSNFIHEIAFDNLGNTWFGCDWENLVKFDGTFFTIYNSSNSALPNPTYINALTSDYQNNIWIGTRSNGIIKFDGLNATTTTISNSSLEGDYSSGITMWSNTVFALVSDNGSYNSSLSYWNGADWVNFSTINSHFPNPLAGISYGIPGDLFVDPTDKSLWISATLTGLIHVIDSSNMHLSLVLSNENINKINSEIIIFPNPFTVDISITNKKENTKITTFSLENIYGQIVYSESLNNCFNSGSKKLDLNFLSKGIYLLEIIIDGERTIKKIVKE